jgi:hypothetical protein
VERAPDPACWLHPDVVVDTSAIAGHGWFAAAPLGAGTVVSRLGGRLVSDAELLSLRAGPDHVDSVVVDEDVHLVLPPRSPNCFGNHSCDPNLGWAGEYTLLTIHDVPAGVELTSDYATSTADPTFLLRCHCETYRCRGIVAGDDWQIPQLQQRYAGYWVPMLRRRIDEAARAR